MFKAYLISALLILIMLAGLTATAYALTRFNDKLARDLVASYN